MTARVCETCVWFVASDHEDCGICAHTERYCFHSRPLIDVRDAADRIRCDEDFCSDWKPVEEAEHEER